MTQVIQKGVFLQSMAWEMTDERTGEVRQGATLYVGSPTKGDEFNPTKGMVLEKYSCPRSFFEKVDPSMTGKQVEVVCELVQRGKNLKLVPQSIALAKAS